MSYDFTPDDLPLLNAAMRAFPHVGDGFRAMVEVGKRLEFPVEAPEALQGAIAEAGTVRYGDSEIPVDDLPALMPAYYFPVESVEDFFTKVSDITARVREPDGRNMAAARLREAVAPMRTDDVAVMDDDEFRRRVDLAGLAVPGVGGIRRRDS